MRNYVQAGDVIDAPAPYARLSGEVALIGNILAVAVADVANGAVGRWKTKGVFSAVAKHGNATGQGWAVGDKLWWDNTNRRFTKTTTGNFGGASAMEVVDTNGTSGAVRLDGVAVVAS